MSRNTKNTLYLKMKEKGELILSLSLFNFDKADLSIHSNLGAFLYMCIEPLPCRSMSGKHIGPLSYHYVPISVYGGRRSHAVYNAYFKTIRIGSRHTSRIGDQLILSTPRVDSVQCPAACLLYLYQSPYTPTRYPSWILAYSHCPAYPCPDRT